MPEILERASQLAGSWYPGSAVEIEAEIGSWRDYARSFKPLPGPAVAAIAPHAGWFFSGRLAFASLSLALDSLEKGRPALIVVLGGHLGKGDPIIAFPEGAWSTPLGPVELAPGMNGELDGHELGHGIWSGPTGDNTIEVLLPLVKSLAPDSRVWALRVPPGPKALALGARLAGLMAQKPGETLILASTDLTHYGRVYGFAPAGAADKGEEFRLKNDRTFIEPALALDPMAMMLAGIGNKAACSAGAAAAAVEAARILGARPRLLDHYSSFDVLPGEQSVGYAGLAFHLLGD
ncbi:MAG: AmmeMemoRadiSam system protein B [Deltaproteobacteria bacterium]|jgi:AmmeMemoRadiSam system protein B|nr:AmmeMemoRadiSam system protein B [Deltaproteobacteria bacterium]